MNRIAMVLAGVVISTMAFSTTTTCFAAEIGYVEDYSLAKDRTVPLKQLIPGTEDYYYYHCLHYQNTEQFGKVEALLKPWIQRYKYTARVHKIRNRQALLTYRKNPQQSLEHIRQRLGIQFNHQREILDRKPNLPTQLNQKSISRATLTQRAFVRYKNLQGFENSALDWLVATPLNAERRLHLLQRLQRPDHENLPKLIADDLTSKFNRGFGAHPIHRQLLLTQLGELLRLQPKLLNQTNFVSTYLTKLHPNPDIDWRHNPQAYTAYLDRLSKFVDQLAPIHNSLKAHVLYHRLVFDRSRGVYNKQWFMQYIKLPRNVSYINPEFLKRDLNRKYAANLGANYQPTTLLPVVGNDEPLVRSYLHQFFVEETTYEPYEPYISDVYLKENFAETKIVNGLGDAEKWYSMLPPAKYKTLQKRVDLDFDYANKSIFAADEQVRLDLYVKNVKTLLVKTYEINAKNFYRRNLREVDTDLNLDGLVANAEKVLPFQEPPLRRVRRHFEFASLKKPGVYVIDFIGNGKSSRVLVRKGKLRYLVRSSTAGHIFTVIDEQNRPQPKATLWLAGREYRPDEDGLITVPFSNQPGRQPVILSLGEFSSLSHFEHASENYSLQAGIFVDREALLKRKSAQVVIRPSLSVNATPVTLSVLEDVRLVLTSVDNDGVATTKEVADFKLHENRESVYEFQVPPRLSRISFTLKARVQNLSQSKKINLAVAETFSLNAIDRSEKVEDMHLANFGGIYVLELLGRTGEPKVDRPVRFSLKHRDFRNPVHVTLQTDDQGRVVLGELADITSISATSPENTAHTWNPPADAHTYHQTVHGKSGETITVPYMGSQPKPERSELSLLKLRGATFVADRFKALSIKDGMLQLKGLPRGDYDLLIKSTGTRIKVRLTDGEVRDNYVLSNSRQLELRGQPALQIEKIDSDKDTITVALGNATEFSRVHVIATRYVPEYPVYTYLSRIRDPEPYLITLPQLESLYVTGRNIGDEYRYIIDRKYQKKFPGNLLQRPSLLLNPWAIRKTVATEQLAEKGTSFAGRGSDDAGGGLGGNRVPTRPVGPHPGFANLNFLAESASVLLNLVPDKKGIVTINRDALGSHQHLHVVAVDPVSTAYRSLSLPESKTEILDLRLANGLDPKLHYTQQKRISVVAKNAKFELNDITTSKFEAYDTLARVYALYSTLNPDPKLIEFGFILNWHKLKDAEKHAKYSEFACHELNFFIAKKDPKFFEAVVRPYLQNKKDQTFFDEWLLKRDLIEHMKPWNHAQLNIAERILLSQRVKGEQAFTSRHVNDLDDLIPPNVERFNHLFDTALKGSALDTGDAFGFDKAAEVQDQLKRLAKMPSFDSPAGGQRANRPTAVPKLSTRRLRADLEQQLNKQENRKKSKAGKPTEELDARADRAKDGKLSEELAVGNRRFFRNDAKKRQAGRQFYRNLDKTQEWVENNYYKLPIEQQNANLITVNAFWCDYANHDLKQPFYSVNLAEASRNFTEMMFALSLLDIPFEAGEHDSKFDGPQMTLAAGSPMVIFHQEIRPAKDVAKETPILVSQNFFRHGDRYRHVNNQRMDKYVTDEFLVHTTYGCQVVVTNPTSSPQKLDVLLQMPVGAIPVLNGRFTRSVNIDLQPYHTQTVDYYFYFPAVGEYQHYPVHVAKNEQLLAHASPVTLKVVKKLTKIDRESWDFVSQQGSDDDVLKYMRQNNLHRIDLNKIAFRMRDKQFFQTVTKLLASRHVYQNTLWSYAILHNDIAAANQFLQHAGSFVASCGSFIESSLLTINPVVRKTYEHMDYRPLVNARAHQLGQRRQILNSRFQQQYHRLLKVLSYQRQLDDDNLMAVTYYMILQDRVDEAIEFLGRVNADKLTTRMQYDYFTAYLDFYNDDHELARDIAEKYAEHPVDRWRKTFTAMVAQLDEIDGQNVKFVDTNSRTQVQTKLANTEPNFEFQVEAKKVVVNYQNLDQVQVNYYLMDVELLFSRNPFVQQYSGQFSLIRPNATQTVKLPDDKLTTTFDLPDQFHNNNVLVEILGAGQTKSQAYYSNSLTLQVVENYGQTRVTNGKTGKPIAKVYVKVYAQTRDGRVKFYKDGYTDLRGRFDYTSLNTNELDNVHKFSLLVLSEEHGAVVREANPPKQ